MFYIQVTSNNKDMTINGWFTVNEKPTKDEALQELKNVKKQLTYGNSPSKSRVISIREWRKEIWGA
jgi:hypothetical protein